MFSFFKNGDTSQSQPLSGKVIALMNQKGGVGKTTMAFNLAHAYAHQGKKVLCVDMDPQGNFSSLFLDEEKLIDEEQKSSNIAEIHRHNIFHLLVNSVRELKALHSKILLDDVLIKTGEGIDLLPSGQELSGFELTVAGINAPRQLILKKFLEKSGLRSLYDVIIIDGPPTLGLIVVNILCAVDGVLYPFIPDRFSEQGLKNIHQVIDDIAEMEITKVPKNLGYIPNLFDTRRKQSSQDLDMIKGLLQGAMVFDAFSNKVQFGKSLAQKKSVFHFNSIDFKELQSQFMRMTEIVEKELFS